VFFREIDPEVSLRKIGNYCYMFARVKILCDIIKLDVCFLLAGFCEMAFIHVALSSIGFGAG
jgi:ubiquitin C-terminal hydrolase